MAWLPSGLFFSNMATRRETLARKCNEKSGHVLVNEEIQARLKQIKRIIQKGTDKRDEEELKILRESPEMVNEVERRAARQASARERKMEVCRSARELSSVFKRSVKNIQNTSRNSS